MCSPLTSRLEHVSWNKGNEKIINFIGLQQPIYKTERQKKKKEKNKKKINFKGLKQTKKKKGQKKKKNEKKNKKKQKVKYLYK